MVALGSISHIQGSTNLSLKGHSDEGGKELIRRRKCGGSENETRKNLNSKEGDIDDDKVEAWDSEKTQRISKKSYFTTLIPNKIRTSKIRSSNQRELANHYHQQQRICLHVFWGDPLYVANQ